MGAPSPERRQAIQDVLEMLKAGKQLRSKDVYGQWTIAKLMAEVRLLGYELHTVRMIPKKRPSDWRLHSAKSYVIYTYIGGK